MSLTVNTLSSGTVAQIKDWAINNNLKYPPNVTKAKAVQYLQGLYHERQQGTNNPTTSIRSLNDLQYRNPDPTMDWLQHLYTHGWTVTPITGWDSSFTNMFFDWFEGCSANFHRDDPTTWKTKNMPVMLHGILKHYYGHTELQWRIRELCVPIFERIWNCEGKDLLCSFDGGCFLPAIPKDELQNRNFKQWIHNDQSRYDHGFCCVQGIVNFMDNGPEDGGLVLVEGSREVFTDYLDKHPSYGITWGSVDMSDSLLIDKPLIKICAPAGSIILFDSRVFHCNVHPTGSIIKADGTPRFRMAHYVSMQPRSGANAKELAKRIKLYEKGRMTGHWCYGHFFKETAEHPRTYGNEIIRPPTIEIAPLNELRKHLIGYKTE